MAASTGSIRIIRRPPPAKVRHRFIQDQIKRELRSVGQAHVDERGKVVADFDTEIKFGYRVSATDKQITLSIMVENSEDEVSERFTVGDLWKSLDKTGTRPHTIEAKKPQGKLRFQTGYQPHTRPIARFGGSGKTTGPVRFAKRVKHPGYPPRKFSDAINKRLRKRFEKAIERGVLLGWRKVR